MWARSAVCGPDHFLMWAATFNRTQQLPGRHEMNPKQIVTDRVKALIHIIRQGIRTLDAILFTDTNYLPQWSRLGILGVLTPFFMIMSVWIVPSILLLKWLQKVKPPPQDEIDANKFITHCGGLARSVLLSMAHQTATSPEWLRPGLFLVLVIVMLSVAACVVGIEILRRGVGM